MSDARPSLYDLLMAIKPDNLTPNAWAARAEVSRSFFTDVRNGTTPKTTTLEKVLGVVGYTMAQFYDLDPNLRQGVVHEQSVRGDLPFRSRNEPMDLPLLGTAQGSDMRVGENGEVQFVERMDLDAAHVVEYLRRPASLLDRRDVYAITVVGNSVAPRYEDGDPAYIDPKRQPRAGDYVVVQLIKREGTDADGTLHIALLKRLVRRTSTCIELEQSNPAIRFTIPITQVHAVHRVIPWREIVFF